MRMFTSWVPWLLALGITFLGLIGGQAVESLQREHFSWEERNHVGSALAQVRAHLESTINGSLLMVHGLSAVIAAQPDIDQQQFGAIARGMLGDDKPLRSIAGAPDLVIRLLYPIAGNEAALGLDYRKQPDQRDAAMAAVDSGRVVVAGPLNLVQGGTALVAREPVFVDDDSAPGGRRLWGLVSAVLDTDSLYRVAGIHQIIDRDGIELALRGRDGRGQHGEPFYGDAAMFDHDPLTASIELPTGNWVAAARPRGGWRDFDDDPRIMRTRVITLLLTGLIAALSYFLSRNAMALRRSNQDLRESQAMFAAFMRNLPAGAFVRNLARDKLLFENHWLRTHLPDLGRSCGTDTDDDLVSLRGGVQLTHRGFHLDDGTTMHCDTLHFLIDDDPRQPLVGGIVMDVSERESLHREVEDQLAELLRWQDVVLGREDRILALKQEVNELLRDSGQAIRYLSPGHDST